MKSFQISLVGLFFMTLLFSVQAQDEQQVKEEQEISNSTVEVYYFHNTRRCATCQAVEDVTKSALEEYYPEQMKSGMVTFQSMNIEDDTNKSIARELNVSGQTLLIVIDGKKKDLTNDAFMYARTNPNKLKEKIQKTIGTI